MNPHFCRVGRIIPNVSKLISLKELETKITNFVDDVSKIDLPEGFKTASI